MPAQASYKQLKEAWIADQTGSSIHSINILGLVMLLTYAIWAALRAKRIAFVRAQHRRHPGPILSAVARLSDWQLEFSHPHRTGCWGAYCARYPARRHERCLTCCSRVVDLQRTTVAGQIKIREEGQKALVKEGL